MVDLKGNEYNVVDYEEKYRKIQLVELDILSVVDRICKKNNLKYFLCGGTMLGAVRHAGFIPWDDDLDIFMPRADYTKFAKIAEKELPDNMYYQDWHKRIDYPYSFAKVHMNGTLLKQKEISHLDMHHGIYIDIFPLDFLPEDERIRVAHLKKVNFVKILMSVRYMSYRKNDRLRRFLECIAITLVRPISKKYIHKKLDKMVMKFDSQATDFYGQETGLNALKEVYPFEWFDKQESILFENKQFQCMESKYIDEYLTFFYGDYMTPPPDNEKCQVHNTVDIDFGNFFEKTEL